jgi:hypothetical protein
LVSLVVESWSVSCGVEVMWCGGKRKTPGHVARELVRDVGVGRPTPLRKEEDRVVDGAAVHRVVSVSAKAEVA